MKRTAVRLPRRHRRSRSRAMRHRFLQLAACMGCLTTATFCAQRTAHRCMRRLS